MADDNTTSTAATQEKSPNKVVTTVVTGVIALAGLAFAGYLFSINQPAVGGTLAGAIVAHYFTAAHGQTISDQVTSAVATVGRLVAPPK